MFRRHPVLCILAGLFSLALASMAVFIATFDLNRYREQLQSTLSATLSQPVHLGEARISLRHGPAFRFADLRIGSGDGETGVLRADHLLLRLELLPLLKREVTFSRILLEAPHFSFTLNPPMTEGSTSSSALLLDQGILEGMLIRSLEISDGTLNLLDRRDPDRPYAVSLEHLEAHLASIALDQPVRLRLAGQLLQEGMSSPFALAGEVTVDRERSRQGGLVNALEGALDLTVDRLAPEPLRQRYTTGWHGLHTAGELSLRVRVNGSPAAGLTVEGRIDSAGLQMQLPDHFREPIAFQEILFKGQWLDRHTSQQFTEVSLQADGMDLAGNFILEQREEGPWVTGELTRATLPLLQIGRLLPDSDPQSVLRRLRQSLGGGTAEVEAVRFSGPLSAFGHPEEGSPLQEGTLRLRDAVFRLERGGPLRSISAVLRLENDLVALKDGKGRFLDTPFEFAGTLSTPFTPARAVTLEAGGTLPLHPLLGLLPTQWPKKFGASGPVPLKLKVEGSQEQLIFDLQADLRETELRWGEQRAKAAGAPGSLFLTGRVTPGRIELSHGRLKISPLEVRASANIDRTQARAFRANLEFAPFPLKELVPFLPPLERFALRGEASGEFDIEGTGGQIGSRKGTLYLRGFGMHLGGAIADINDANGEFRLLDDGLDFEHASAKLGISPLRIDGALRNFSDPRLELTVQAKTIRADELIFHSDKLVLRDVDGHLVIDKDGILFDPVKVRLSGGTRAVVKGALQDFRAPQVNLDIEAEQANIDEVIALWQRPTETPPEMRQPETGKGKVTVEIDARVKDGVLGPLNFQNAEGKIGYKDGILTIFPLHFEAGIGRCSGQVAVERQATGASLLKMSGHLENFDAMAVQHEILKMRGIITGTLQGDFYLEGEPGKEFLATSLGGFSLQIKNGVLHKFQFLSKVFSLLNVSQILTFNLPDMAREGMPFKRLKGNLSLSKGILSTDDLFVDSNAMNLSLVGNSDLATRELDLILGVKPLRTVDKIVTQIPIAGWLLTGEEKALITAHFEIKGKSDDPEVTPIPITSVSETVLGIFKRVLGLPGKVVTDMGDLLQGEKK